jgi:hypothetical protein
VKSGSRTAAIFLLLFAGAWLAAPAATGADLAPKITPIENQKDQAIKFSAEKNGNVSWDINTGITRSNGPATITYGDLTIDAGDLEFNIENGDFAATKGVKITRTSDNFSWTGLKVHGNIKTHQFSFNEYRGVLDKLHMRGRDGTYKQNGANVFGHISLTSCDLEHPHYHLSASSFTYYPDKTFKATNLIAWAGPVPIFYLPYLTGNLNQESEFEYKLGYNNKWGAIIGIGKTWNYSNLFLSQDRLKTRFFLDERTKSGPGLENKTEYITEDSLTRLYMLGRFDRLATKDVGKGSLLDMDTDYYRGFLPENLRYRASIFHRQDFSDNTPGLTLQARGEILSDAYMLHDWGKGEYRRNPQSLSYAQLAWDSDYFIVTGYARPKLTYFDSVTERLPEVRIDTPRTNLLGSALQYQSSTDVVSLNMRWREYDNPQYFSPADYDAVRIDTKHFFYLPFTAFNDNLQLTPRAGFDLTHYSATSKQAITSDQLNTLILADDPYTGWRSIPISGWPAQYDTLGGSDTRLAGEVGLELSTKFYRTWQDCKKDLWLLKLDGLRHVVQPYMNYTLTTDPTLDREHIPFFDEVDQLDKQHFVQVGLRQRWQTRKNQRIFTFASLDAYANIHVQDGYGIQDRDGVLGDIGLRGSLRPTDVLTFIADVVTDAENQQVNFARTTIQYGDPKDWTVGLGYIYTANHFNRPAYSLGSSVDAYGPAGFPMVYNFAESQFVTANWNWTIKPSIGLKVGYLIAYDVMNNRVARQGFMIQRDLHCWTGALQAMLDSDNQLGFFFVLTLKAYPQVKMGTSVSGLSNNEENQ